VTRKVDEHFQKAHEVPELIRQHWNDLGGAPDQLAAASRMKTARSAAALVKALRKREPAPLVEALAAAPIETSAEAMGKSLASAEVVIQAMHQTQWDLFQGLTRLQDDRRGAAQAILQQVRKDLGCDELALAQGLAETLKKQSREAARLLASAPPPVYQPGDGPSAVTPPAGAKRIMTIDRGEGQGWDAARLGRELEELRRRLEADPALRVSLSWTLFKEEAP
jgi:hypothetical protein